MTKFIYVGKVIPSEINYNNPTELQDGGKKYTVDKYLAFKKYLDWDRYIMLGNTGVEYLVNPEKTKMMKNPWQLMNILEQAGYQFYEPNSNFAVVSLSTGRHEILIHTERYMEFDVPSGSVLLQHDDTIGD